MLFRCWNGFRVAASLVSCWCAVLSGNAAVYEEALERAGENRSEIEQFVLKAERDHGAFGKRAATYLVSYMPEKDLLALTGSFLTENLDFAMKARASFPWASAVPENLFFNDVLPYASLDESRERWRPRLYELGRAIVAEQKSISEAV